MHIVQRQVTTLDLHDGKVRDYALLQDDRGYRLTGLSRDDVLHILLTEQDLDRLFTACVRILPLREEAPWEAKDAHAVQYDAGELGTYAWGRIRIEQRQITTIDLEAHKTRRFEVRQDDCGYRISCSSDEEALYIRFPVQDFQKLRGVFCLSPKGSKPVLEEGTPASATNYVWTPMDWLSFN